MNRTDSVLVSPHHAPPEPRRLVPMHLYYESPTFWWPQPADAVAVFLAGGITGCEDWQARAARLLGAAEQPLVVLNPRRTYYDRKDPKAPWEQFSWEQRHLRLDGVLTMFWFPASAPGVLQALAFAELAQALAEGRPVVVGADPGYPRCAEVRMWCQVNRACLAVYSRFDEVVEATLHKAARLARSAV